MSVPQPAEDKAYERRPPAGPAPDVDLSLDERHAFLESYLDDRLMELQASVQMPVDAQRAEAIRTDTDEYVSGLLQLAALEDPTLGQTLEEKGGAHWQAGGAGSMLGYLTEHMAKSMPTRLSPYMEGKMDKEVFNAGVLKQLRNLVTQYQSPRDARTGRPRAA